MQKTSNQKPENTDYSPQIQLRSPEVQELIGHLPRGFMRYGIGIILSILLFILVLCHFVPYDNYENIKIRILPNMVISAVTVNTDGYITYCHVAENETVKYGDTLLTLQANDTQYYSLVSPQDGTVHFHSFCVPNEFVKKGQALMEIRKESTTPIPAIATADSLPITINLSEKKDIIIELSTGQNAIFNVKKEIENHTSQTKSILLQSSQPISIPYELTKNVPVKISDSNLLEKLLKTGNR